jgi:hypothetical protein
MKKLLQNIRRLFSRKTANTSPQVDSWDEKIKSWSTQYPQLIDYQMPEDIKEAFERSWERSEEEYRYLSER